MTPDVKFFILVCSFLLNVTVADDTCLNQDVERSAEYKLVNDLLCNYNSAVRPVKDHTSTLKVSMINRIHKIIPGEESYGDDTVTVNSVLILFWTDEYLTWTPADYQGIESVTIAASKIWVPQIVLTKSGVVRPSSPYEYNAECSVANQGNVICLPKVSHTANCKGDHNNWPFDTQVCTLVYMALSYRGEYINITSPSVGTETSLRTLDSLNQKNRYWELTDMNVTRLVYGSEKHNMSWPSLQYRLELKRHSATYVAIVIAPAIAMILLTLMSLSLHVASQERIILISVNLFCHYLYLQQLFWVVPHNGDSCPLVVLFYRDSLMVTVFALLTTLLLKSLLSCTSDRVDSFVGIISQRPLNLITFRMTDRKSAKEESEENSPEDEAKAAGIKAKVELENKWMIIVLFLDRLQFICVILVYFGLVVALFI